MTQSHEQPSNFQPPLQPGQIQSGKTVETSDMLVRFSDGEHIIQGWMVAHLGGNAEIENQRADFLQMSHANFVRGFFEEAGAQQLKGFQKAIFTGHLSGFKKQSQQRFRLGR